jgi:transcriptional regulator with XRE-family HTH domain
MYVKLTIQEKLKDERVNRHMSLAELAEATGISKSTLDRYEKDDCTDMSPFNLAKLAEYYGLSLDYLMGLTENKNHPNTSLSELHLDDSTVDLLKSSTLNNRLICEMICHPVFPRLLADMQICVDRIADMRFHDMNIVLDAARQTVMEQYSTDENDVYMRTLELGQVSEDMFFKQVIHNDLDMIVKDIRTRHEADKTTADPETPANSLIKKIPMILLDCIKFNGTLDERRAYTICKMNGVEYMTLSEEERLTLIRIFKKSSLYPAAISQRGKSKIRSLFDRKKS